MIRTLLPSLTAFLGTALTAAGGALLLGSGFAWSAEAQVAGPFPHILPTCIAFRTDTAGKLYAGLAEFAQKPEEQEWGMMYRTNLAETSAMIFDMRGQTDVAFWMKNTPSSLDIAFFDTRGRLVHVARATTPLSSDLIGPDPRIPISHALEIPAGKADSIGLIAGSSHMDISKPFDCPKDFP